MRMVDLIQKKKSNEELAAHEITWIIEGYTKKEIPEYQMSAFLMSVYFNGMTPKERLALTMAMVDSGDRIDLSSIEGVKVDKHSTGGVGDKTSLILGPLVAAAGVPVAKMSGRGLGFTGGTLDKLEAIEGLKIEIPMQDFIRQVNDIKLAIIGQSMDLAPADKYLYALRDVTATVDSIPLISSSIMSKKLAAGADAIVLDVKFGSGAFMKTLDDARELARAMVEIGQQAGRQTSALLTDMNQPLGRAIGNALEIKEAIETLNGHGPKDLEEIVLQLGAQMLYLAKKSASTQEGYDTLKNILHSGKAIEIFKAFVQRQGGNLNQIQDPSLLPTATHKIPILAQASGFIKSIDAYSIGIAAMKLGAGRATKEASIDLAVGIVLDKKVGEEVHPGDVLAYLHVNDQNYEEPAASVLAAYIIQDAPVAPPTLIYDTIS